MTHRRLRARHFWHPQARRQRGQAAFEYVVISAAIVVALLVRVQAFGGRSAVALLVDAIRLAWRAFSYALATPV